MKAHPVLLRLKYLRIINGFAVKTGIPLRAAFDLFYKSYTYQLISQGVADMHCHSDGYLVDELAIEYNFMSPPGPEED